MRTTSHAGDPRLDSLFGLDDPELSDIRPVVQRPRSGFQPWAFGLLLGIAATSLFVVLESRLQLGEQPAVRTQADAQLLRSAEAPPLYLPPMAIPQRIVEPPPEAAPFRVRPTFPPNQTATVADRQISKPLPVQSAPILSAAPYVSPAPAISSLPRTSSGSIVVADSSVPGGSEPTARSPRTAGGQGDTASVWGGPPRVRSGTLSNKAGTVAQGSMIAAVLETALDSNQRGYARALVSRDVKSFDGSRVLIPRGSRLIGEYQSQLSPGERRAGIIWTRIIRPDGTTMDLDSPAVDPLGRSGVPASVNTHFFAQFGSALLRTTLDIGAGFASRASRSPVIVALPGTLQGQATASIVSPVRPPTLRVPAGKSISVFVARDLDFGVDERQP